MNHSDQIDNPSFTLLLDALNRTLKTVFYEDNKIEEFIQQRGFPEGVLESIMAVNPLSAGIPEEYGGRGAIVRECLGILDAASYESLPLSLIFGINMALFLSPVAKYGQEGAKAQVFNRFLTQQNMGGLMITEPDYGSDALNMQTSDIKRGSIYHIKGIKHWQGLTGMADYWLMTSRQKSGSGELGRDIDFFICDTHQSEQAIRVEEYYNNIGLYPIPYGRNIVNIQVPEEHKLEPESTGLKLMMDLLHRSRLHFPGMGMGFIRRMLDDAIEHCTNRIVGGKALLALDQVRFQLSRIQSAFTVCSAMCSRSALIAGIENNLAGAAVEANSMKAYITDLMQETAQILTQLSGANGYKTEHVGARGIVDSRPFRIFEGSNEMLYTQISEIVIKMMERQKIQKLSDFLLDYTHSLHSAEYFKSLLNLKIASKLPQRKIVDLGKIISRVVAANNVIELGESGFRSDLIKNSLETIKQEISILASSFQHRGMVSPIEPYKEGANWLDFC